MRNIGKLVGLALLVAVTPLLSTCNKAEQTPPKSHVSPMYGSPNDAWSRLLRTLWPRLYVRAAPVAKSTTASDLKGPKKEHNAKEHNAKEHNAYDAWGTRDVEPKPSIQRRRPRAEQHPASTRHRRDAERQKAGHTQQQRHERGEQKD